MRFLADESCDGCMVRALQEAGHDVVAVAEAHQGTDDTRVIELAVDAERILITEDKDFGQLVHAAGHGHGGVILLRYPFQVRHRIAAELVALAGRRGQALWHAFVVIEPGRIRILTG